MCMATKIKTNYLAKLLYLKMLHIKRNIAWYRIVYVKKLLNIAIYYDKVVAGALCIHETTTTTTITTAAVDIINSQIILIILAKCIFLESYVQKGYK